MNPFAIWRGWVQFPSHSSGPALPHHPAPAILATGMTPKGGMPMILSTLENPAGYRVVRHLGLVQGSTVRSKHVGRDIMAGLKEIVGGELRGYTELLNEAREEATARMRAAAEELGANAIISIRYGTANIGSGAAEVLAYGTAVEIVAEQAAS